MPGLRFLTIPAFAAVLLLARPPQGVAAASFIVECGQVAAYTAPDPTGPADGALTLGLLPSWTIAAGATVSAAVAANLAGLAGSSPTCLSIDLDDLGVITSVDFATEGVVGGAVVEDAGLGGYVFAARVLIPTFITDAYPGLAAVFGTSAAAGTDATTTFSVDTSTGQFTGLDARAAFCGPADLAGNGDGLVGAAAIPASVLGAGATEALDAANMDEACAVVRVLGVIGNEGLEIETEVAIVSQPNTSAVEAPAPGSPTATAAALAALVALAASLIAGSRRWRGPEPAEVVHVGGDGKARAR
jgi:hypothetical protein